MLAKAPRARHARGLHGAPRGGRERGRSTSSSRATCPVRSRRSRTRCSRSTSATRSTCGSSTAVSVRSPRPTSTWPRPPTRSSSASTSGPQGKATRAGRPRGRRDPLLLGHLPGDRGDRGGAQGHAQAGVRGGRSSGTAEIREIFRSSQDRQHRRLHGPLAATIRRNAKARLIRDGAVVADNLDDRVAAPRSRTTSPRSARASSAVSTSATSTTSRSATSSRPSRCGRSRAQLTTATRHAVARPRGAARSPPAAAGAAAGDRRHARLDHRHVRRRPWLTRHGPARSPTGSR